MNYLIAWYRELQQTLRYKIEIIRQRNTHNNDIILSRTACLGTAVQANIQWGRSINHQKNRADLIISPKEIITIPEVYRFLVRKDIASLVHAQRNDFFSYHNVSAVIFDSFSELVDREFKTGDSKYFYASKSDVNIQLLQKEGGYCGGLLDLTNIFEIYDELISRIYERYKCKIYYLNFPTKFEKREIFIERANILAETSDRLMKKHKHFINVKFPLESVHQGSDSFPYHYSQDSHKLFSEHLISVARQF